jgi:hypothetical protein
VHVRGVGRWRRARHLVNVELSTKMEDETRGFTRETTRGKEKVGSNQEVGNVHYVNFSRYSGVVAGRARVF